MTADKRQQNLAVAQRYVELYNTDPERFVRECYHADYKVGVMGIGWYEGIDKFIAVEKAVWNAAPGRRMKVLQMHATDEVVVVEAAVTDPGKGADWELPFVAVLEIRGDKIAVDRTYADFKTWPGLDAVL
jgi:limonene-1,2-epoxide hydrolase